ncbi:carboxymuconolactone decarboxylase family protein [Serratia marcescens]|uniref:carboxymuconolactone decarboxylase family protein n=2 Tax=Serratia TaxID=613 RepID=UPI003204DD23
MAKFTLYTPDTASLHSRLTLENIQKRNGFIPSLYAVMAGSPPVLDAYLALHDQFLRTDFTSEEKAVVWQTINVENNCHYCVPAHTAIAKSMNVGDNISDALRNETPLPAPRLEALRTFTLAMVRERGQVKERTLDDFFMAGYTHNSVLNVILCIAQKTISNYTNHVANTPLDEPFRPFIWRKKT